ncbi:MAG: DUF3311 domain-containing protein [Proteobacteria bacterium]|nr:DUF3311 domain-containing protein [Pseudomonadota bacterium]
MRNLLFTAYVVLCLAALIWPGYDWLGNRIEPYVLGVPFSLAWVVGWVVLTFVVLLIYHVTGAPSHEAGRFGDSVASEED